MHVISNTLIIKKIDKKTKPVVINISNKLL